METDLFETTGSSGFAAFKGRTWVTRQGVQIDRIASAWLIRRFIDPQARFRFVASEAYQPIATEVRRPGEARFRWPSGLPTMHQNREHVDNSGSWGGLFLSTE